MPLTPGERLGPYEALSPIGAGGMGEVYKARDTRLERFVAIKVLPEHIAQRDDLRARFEREARTVASLNHPHICTLYDIGNQDGTGYMVMEYMEGETLAARIAKGALPPGEALKLAIQIADALDRAHQAGVTHRDIKPGNIMLTRDGAKVLDFGLAKSPPRIGPADETLLAPLTVEGTILGTPQYMAPEQVGGKEADTRSDIWAFGAVFYEMLTGRAAFGCGSISETMKAVLTQEPDCSAVPEEFHALIRRCLEKDPGRRLRDLGDLTLLLPESKPTRTRGQRRNLFALIGLGVAVGALAVFLIRQNAPPSTPAVSRFTIPVDPGEELTDAPAVSPDGRYLAYSVQTSSGDARLYLRDLSLFTPIEVAASGGASQPFFSGDGKWLGFFARGQLQKIAVGGGTPVPLAPAAFPFGATFTDDGSVVFVPDEASGLRLIRPGTGKVEVLTRPEGGKDGVSHLWPQAVPGTEYVLFSMYGGQSRGVAALSLKTGRWQLVLAGKFGGFASTSSGNAVRLFVSDAAAGIKAGLWNANRPGPVTAETTVLENVYYQTGGGSLRTSLAVSPSGTAVYIPGDPSKNTLSWVDRDGRAESAFPAPAGILHSVLSPDGTKVTVSIGADLWIYDLAAGTQRPLTFYDKSGGVTSSPMWSRDGKRVLFAGQEGSDYDLYSQPADGSRPAEVLLKRPHNQFPTSMAPDGTIVFGEAYADHAEDMYTLSPKGEVIAVRVTPTFSEVNAQFSPDGKRLAYQSDESGRNEIYVENYPGGLNRSVVSTQGGTIPMWSRDGKELFYVGGGALMVAAVSSGGSFGPGRRLFDRTNYNFFWHSYDPAPDGKRLLMVRRAPGSAPKQLNVILNWNEQLQRLLSASGK